MMAEFIPCLDVLPAAQQSLLSNLKDVTTPGFVLYRGTAIALRLGHRQSVDFDFFTEKTFTVEELLKILPWLAEGEVTQNRVNTFTTLVNEVKLSFLGGLPFGRVGLPDQMPNSGFWVAALEDLLDLKLAVILKRIEMKDYLDIIAILKSGISLQKGLAIAKLFYPTFSAHDALRSLVYFEGGDLHNLSLGS